MLNKVILMGRLTADPELRQTTSGISTCRFSVAVDRPYRKDQERQADFIRVNTWRQTAEFVSRYFSKGKMIIVEGSLRNNDYTDANGVKHYSMEVQADNVSFGESKGGGQQQGNFAEPVYQQPAYSKPQQQTAPAPAQTQPAQESIQLGDLSDFEEILSDGEVPF
ncbi:MULTISPECIES: single-stranded DNA-binding protein [Ruminococcus]|uniref:single-stranded DNA-binding protein n=1 Tax=Ruminococcus TaxID=1263 RepID=UPI00033D20D1|nr:MULTISPECIES: single-stranded DNA-binding protein [Ruminococcus]CDD53579.1 single-stranded DNA-binding protein [Ruminococcus sp. CAG:379]